MNTTFSHRIHNRMLQLYEVITIWHVCYAHAPTVRELAAACGIRSTSTVELGLEDLRACGLATWKRRKARTVRVI